MKDYAPILLVALGGILLGGAYSLWTQKMKPVAWVSLAIVGVMSLLAAFLTNLR